MRPPAEMLLDTSLLGEDLMLLGVRHHSPACASFVARVLRARRPATVCVEGPSDYNPHMHQLQDPALEAPVALFSFAAVPVPDEGGSAPGDERLRPRLARQQRSAGWYPFCDYSPELVAIRVTAEIGARALFCDLPLHARPAEPLEPDQDLFALQTQRRAALLAHLRARLGARDDDEAWERLFERDGADREITTFARDIAAYGGLLRADTPDEALQAQGDLDREAFMAGEIHAARAQGPVAVVCGAFHLAGLAARLRENPPRLVPPPLPRGAHAGTHLTAYDFQRMSRLRYAAGVPAPGWYQAQWEGPRRGAPPWLRVLVSAGRSARKQGYAVSAADVIAAADLASRLARLRGHDAPTRAEVEEAARSAWARGVDGEQGLTRLIQRALQGEARGKVGPSAGDPPLVQDVDRLLSALSLEDGGGRELRLRPVRAASDRARAQTLARLLYLGVEYGSLQRGPDLLSGKDLDRVEQVWALSWTPEVRARLFESSPYGVTLLDATAERLRERLVEGGASADAAVSRLIEAAALGLRDLTGPLLDEIRARLEVEPRLSAALRALDQLVLLQRARAAYGALHHPALPPLVTAAWERSLFLLDDLPRLDAEREPEAIGGLRALGQAAEALEPTAQGPGALDEALTRLRPLLSAVPGAQGATDALLHRRGRLDEAALAADLANRLRDADPEAGGRFFDGLLALSRRAFVEGALGLEAATDALLEHDEDAFRARLPRLRLSFAGLAPAETARLAAAVSARWGEGRPLSLGLAAPADRLMDLGALEAEIGLALGRWGLATSNHSTSEYLIHNKQQPAANPEALRRWRLILGRFGAPLPEPSPGADAGLDEVLGFLYDREYGKAEREQRGATREGGQAGSALRVPEWLGRLDRLFPRETCERLEAEALRRYGLEELLQDPALLERCQPSMALLEAVLRLKDRMQPPVLAAARRVVRVVAEELRARLRTELRLALSGRLRQGALRPRGGAASFDARATLRRNLRHYDLERRAVVVARPWFRPPRRSFSDWRIILAVDQSGSMLSSVVHAAIIASIFAEVSEISTHLLAFDTSVIDLSDQLADPVATLLGVQLGGGTNIGAAVSAAEALVTLPQRTLLVLVSDLYEGADPNLLVARVHRLTEAGVRVLALAALDERAEPAYDRAMGARLAALGAKVAALTPSALVAWVAEVIG